MSRRFGTLCSIFIVDVSRKNNRNEIARVFVEVKNWLKNILSQSEREGTRRGHV